MPADAAEDVAIWVDPAFPERSVVVGSNKKAGLHVYDLAGRERQFVPLGRTNGVDLRSAFLFSEGPAPVVAASIASGPDEDAEGTIVILPFDETSRRISTDPLAVIATRMKWDMGVCLYQSPEGTLHVGAARRNLFRQWRLEHESDGSITASLVRELMLKSIAEACVYDDALRRLYIAQEDLGVWRLPADPANGNSMTLVDGVKPKGGLTPDVEGLAIYAHNNGTGYLIVSSQGDDSFRVYRRDGDNHFVGSFRVVVCPDGNVDGVTHTDGIEVTSTPLGEKWPAGVLIMQDHENTSPEEPQNFKYLAWDQIERRLHANP
jgi:3-phytase